MYVARRATPTLTLRRACARRRGNLCHARQRVLRSHQRHAYVTPRLAGLLNPKSLLPTDVGLISGYRATNEMIREHFPGERSGSTATTLFAVFDTAEEVWHIKVRGGSVGRGGGGRGLRGRGL